MPETEGRGCHAFAGELVTQAHRAPMGPVPPQLEHSGLDHCGHLEGRGLGPVRAVRKAREALGLITGQPGVHRVSMHAELLGYLGDSHPFG